MVVTSLVARLGSVATKGPADAEAGVCVLHCHGINCPTGRLDQLDTTDANWLHSIEQIVRGPNAIPAARLD